MLTEKDLLQIQKKGISEEQLNKQLHNFETGFPFLKIEAAASVEKGIAVPSDEEAQKYINLWNETRSGEKCEEIKVVKFVPASGAASRMFKNIFAFLDADYNVPTTDFEKNFFDHIHDFAFFDALDKKCHDNLATSVDELIANGEYKSVAANMIYEKGLNYGQLPKGLLEFHKYGKGPRTPIEEHLAEGAMYAVCGVYVRIHFTVSEEHLEMFKAEVTEKKKKFERLYGVLYDVTYSVQKSSTDTVAVNPDNTLFRNDDGSMLFRPGGHGALIENLNDIDADVIFIKNIDNVVPDSFKRDTVRYKQLIAGMAVSVRDRLYANMERLEKGGCTRAELDEMLAFLEKEICCHKEGTEKLSDAELAEYLKTKFNRPLRVCGVVRNVGEAGGGPFLAYNPDGSVSLQILESSQIDKNDARAMDMFQHGTHFNPVDLVCVVKDYKGKKFNLPDYVDPATGFISSKSKNGKELKALELPGLWNGAMSDWNTIFVEVPLSTFNPVKTVNDLLRKEHSDK